MSNIVERLQAFNQNRDSQLVALKYKLMRADAFAFLRGTDHLFYADWSAQSPLNAAPATWSCGDLHWQNLGSYKGDNRLVYFNINDFDEAVLAPCTWDLARLLVSILIGAHTLHLKDTQSLQLGPYFLDKYSHELRKGHVLNLEEDNTTGLAKALLFQLRTRNRKAFLDSHTRLVDQKRQLIIDGKHATVVTPSERAAVTTLLQQWGVQQPHQHFFDVLDVAHRIAGVGSLGIDRYIVLVKGKGSPDSNYLLDLKAEGPSSLQPYLTLPQPHWSSDAQRCVTIQRWMQGIPPALLTPLELNGQFYILRELQPDEDKINTASLDGNVEQAEKFIKTIATVLAWDQLRSAGQQGAAIATDLINFASASHWQDTLLDYARMYATQVNKDYAVFCSAYDRGAFKPAAS